MFIIEFWGVLEDQPGSVVVLEQCQETEIPGSILGGYLQISFFFNLAEKNSFTVKKIPSVAEMVSTVYETEICIGDALRHSRSILLSSMNYTPLVPVAITDTSQTH